LIGNKEGIYILFRQSDFWFALPSEILLEIVRYPEESEVSDDRITLRNEEMHLFYFDEILHKKRKETSLSQRNILILEGDQGKIGLAIDNAEEVNNLPESAIYPIIPLILKRNQNMYLGVALVKNRLVTILDHVVIYEQCCTKRSGKNKEDLNGA